MKSTARIFYILSAFFVVVGIAYAIITGRNEPMGIEPVGFAAFLAAAGLALMIAIYLSMNVKAHPDRPEDNLHAEVEDEAGVQGSFAPYSWWPRGPPRAPRSASWVSPPAGGSSPWA